MKTTRWQSRLAAALLIVAIALYGVRWYAFPGAALHSEMWRFLLGDIAFLFLQVLLVTLVIDGLIRRRERDEMRSKLNMVIGAFFTETGADLLGQMARADAKLAEVREQLIPEPSWKAADFGRARRAFSSHQPQIDLTYCDLERLRGVLEGERSFVISLLTNQTLLEHEAFTDLLWAVAHLGEELAVRPHLSALPVSDSKHLSADLQRAYVLLGVEWISYLEHLQDAYPFLFSLAVRTNPLDPEANAIVTE